MKYIFLPVALVSIAWGGALFAQETDQAEVDRAEVETMPKVVNTVADADNPGMALLDQATEAKLRASSLSDLSQVIALCLRAKQEGLTGDNLRYCNQLLATAQLQRGLILAQQQLSPTNTRLGNGQTLRYRTLSDLEEAVTVIKDQPIAFLRIAQLNLMPDGDEDRAKEALTLAIQIAHNEPAIQILAVRLLTEIEPDAGTRAAVLSDAAKDGNPEIAVLHAITLIELDQRDAAKNTLEKLIEGESGNVELHERIVKVLVEAGEHELAMSVLDAMREKGDDEHKNQIDMMRVDILNALKQHEEALKLLNVLCENFQGNTDAMVMVLLIRSNTHLALDNFDEALKDVAEVEQLRPHFPLVLEQKYRILSEQENYSDALTVVEELQTIVEQPQDFLFLREAHLLVELERYDEAIEVIQAMLARVEDPEDEPQWKVFLVEIYSKQQNYDKALTLVEEHLKENPEELRWILTKAAVYSAQKKWDEAVNWLESQLEKAPDSRAISLALIGTLADRKSFRAARERMQPLLTQEPANLMLLRIDSQLSISLGLHAEAVSALEKVVEADPNDYTSVNNLAWVLATSPIDSVRDGRRAVELAEKAGALTRFKRAFVLSTLAAAYAEAGDFGKAREWSVISVDVAKNERGKTEEARQELLEHLQKEWDAFSQDLPFREMLNEEEE